jgi:hypothetical protein
MNLWKILKALLWNQYAGKSIQFRPVSDGLQIWFKCQLENAIGVSNNIPKRSKFGGNEDPSKPILKKNGNSQSFGGRIAGKIKENFKLQ